MLTIASQMGAAFDQRAAERPGVARLISLPDNALPLRQVAQEADVLLVRPAPLWQAMIGEEKPPGWPGRITWVQSASAGVDFYPRWLGEVPYFSCGRGIASEEIADYVIAALYAQVKPFDQLAVRGPEDWIETRTASLLGRDVAILGLGSIGMAVARRLTTLGARVIGVRRSSAAAPEGIILAGSIAEAISAAQDIVVTLPATLETRGVINAALLSGARPGAHLVNVSRGSIVRQDDLLRALDGGPLGFATLDVTDPEPLPEGHRLYSHPRVRLTPHLSCNWAAIMPALHQRLLDNIDKVTRGEMPPDLVMKQRGY